MFRISFYISYSMIEKIDYLILTLALIVNIIINYRNRDLILGCTYVHLWRRF